MTKPVGESKTLIELRNELAAQRLEIERLRERVDLVLGRTAKDVRPRPRPGHAPRHSPLDEVKAVLSTTADLRTPETGKLAADRIATLFGITLSELASWLGKSRQALAKTPDADSLQAPLEYFERVARLRLVTTDAGFRRWLRMPNDTLGGKAPLKWLEAGEWQAMADKVDDMLTGAPT